MTDKLPPLPDFGWTCLCTKCGRTWEIDKPQKSADCQCGYAAFVVQNKRPTVEQMQEYARQAVREAVPEPLTDAEIWSMARKMADLFDYPWGSMPIEGRRRMFMNVKTMIAAAKEADK